MSGKLINISAGLNDSLLNVVWLIIGLIAIYVAFKNLFDKENPSRIGTFIFWGSFGTVVGFGTYLPSKVSGLLVVVMCIPPILKRVNKGKIEIPVKEYTKAQFTKIGSKIFIPAFCIGAFSLILAVFTNLKSMVAIIIGVLAAVIILILYDPKKNTPKVFLKEADRNLSIIGPLCLLPLLSGCMGGVFMAAGVGDVIAKLMEKIIPKGNVTIGIIALAVSMAVFTAIMGNAFASIAVIMSGIGAPFVLSYGVNPALVGMVALTCGYCGTLLTPMAANYNIVPVAVLNMKDRLGVIKNQVLIAIIMLIFQICYMLIAR